MKLQGFITRNDARDLAFTRIDLIALIFVLFLAAAVANPLFTSHSRARSDTLVCQANLAQVGRAYQLWASDHEERAPFVVPEGEGGLSGHPLRLNAFVQFSWVSNGLVTPKVLVCPADTNTIRRASDFSDNANGGFLNSAYRNNAVSYMLNFHAQRYVPRSILSGDRNIERTPAQMCSYAGATLRTVEAQDFGSEWGRQIHWEKGNLVFYDGSVEEASTARLRAACRTSADDAPGDRIHALFPR